MMTSSRHRSRAFFVLTILSVASSPCVAVEVVPRASSSVVGAYACKVTRSANKAIGGVGFEAEETWERWKSGDERFSITVNLFDRNLSATGVYSNIPRVKSDDEDQDTRFKAYFFDAMEEADKVDSPHSWGDSRQHVRLVTGANWHLAVTFSGDASHADVDWSTLLPIPKTANLTGTADGQTRVVRLIEPRQFDVFAEAYATASKRKTVHWIRPLDGLMTHCATVECIENCASDPMAKAIEVICFIMLAFVFLAPFIANYVVIRKGALCGDLAVTVPDELRDLYDLRKKALRNLLTGVVVAEAALLLITLSILSFFLPGTPLDEGIFFLVALPLFVFYCASCTAYIFVAYDLKSFLIVSVPSTLTAIGCIVASSLLPEIAFFAVSLALLMVVVVVQSVRLHRVTSRVETASASWPPLNARNAASHRHPARSRDLNLSRGNAPALYTEEPRSRGRRRSDSVALTHVA
ncbi:MAG: hypothetical protein MHM6MM_003257 [Cercozoa sp. M6MM]